MKAMLLREITSLKQNETPLSSTNTPKPVAGEGEILLRVTRCGVCHTELDEIEGRTPPPHLPVILGHQVVGVVEGIQSLREAPPRGQTLEVQRQETLDSATKVGQRVGVAWIASACGHCQYCLSGADFVHPIPDAISDSEAAPLLCAGAVGYRALKLCNLQDGKSLGLMGFGGSNHIVLKTAKYKYPNSKLFVFSRNPQEREFALSLGAAWAGAIDEVPPEGLDALIDTTPVWAPISEGLKRLKPGGRLVINAIRKEEVDKDVLLKLDYPSQLWMEKEIKSVANVTRADVREFLQLAAEANIKPEYQEFELKDANQALLEMKQGKIRGAKVLRVKN